MFFAEKKNYNGAKYAADRLIDHYFDKGKWDFKNLITEYDNEKQNLPGEISGEDRLKIEMRLRNRFKMRKKNQKDHCRDVPYQHSFKFVTCTQPRTQFTREQKKKKDK